uniref:uncharacterized protein LOC122587705 n=1 Tax=Erigeron canadensis TaxID=72917 RepID=UPI001CB921DD|nr:uncharacterized protein LOC122587705 [Erigeron canadensis]
METILKAHGLFEISTEDNVDEKKENITKAMVFQTLPQDVLTQVAQYESAKEVWDSIKVKYLGADLVQKARLQTLRIELETLRMKANEKVSDYEGKLSSIKAKFKGLGETLKDKVLVRKLLNSVPKKFLPIVASIEQCEDLDKMLFEEAVGKLIAFEERLKSQDEHEENYQDKLLMASSSNQGRGRNFNKVGKGRGRDTKQGEQGKNKMRCYNCGEFGHLAYECTKWKEKDKNEVSHLVYHSDEDSTLL